MNYESTSAIDDSPGKRRLHMVRNRYILERFQLSLLDGLFETPQPSSPILFWLDAIKFLSGLSHSVSCMKGAGAGVGGNGGSHQIISI